MNKLICYTFFLFLTCTVLVNPQTSPKEAAEKFLQLCIEGKRPEACELYGTEGSKEQIAILLHKMVMNDIPFTNTQCKYTMQIYN